jgi:two-component system, cell cycle response regulator
LKNKVTILIVDDSTTSRKEIIRILSSQKIADNYIEAGDGSEGLRILLSKKKVDLVISDWLMPKINGLKLLQTIRSHSELCDIPCILITVKDQMKEKILGFQQGATDYISKPFHPDEFTVRVINLLKIREVQEALKVKNKKLEKLSTLDPLTGLYNRNYLKQALTKECIRSQRFNNPIGCLMVDIDLFKNINDTLGHQAGDEVLKEMAIIISSLLRGYDFCCRYGGDEFIVILPENSKEGVKIVGERLREKVLLHPFLKRHKLQLTISIWGVSIQGEKAKDAESIIAKADKALYRAKKAGKNRLCVL